VLYQFAAMILDGGAELESGDAAGHLGVAHALVGHLRAFGLNASRGRLVLPLSVFTSNGVTEGEIFSGTVSEGLLAAHAQLLELAREHLHKAAGAVALLPRELRPAFAMIGLLNSELRGIEARAEAPFAPPPRLSDWRKIVALALWGWRNG
jgi:phytoene synthase